MALAKQDIEYIKTHLAEWLVEQSVGKPLAVYEIELRKRIVRVEEALKHQGRLIQGLIEQMEKRFEQVDKRFEQVDKRFEQVDKRFEQVDVRLDQMEKRFDQVERRLELIEKHLEQVDKRFEQVDKRFEQIDRRFEQMDKRFEAMTQRIDRFMIWSFGITIAAAGTVIGVLRLWPPGHP